MLHSGVRPDRPTLEGAPRLRLIVRAGVGLDQIDTACAAERGVRVVMLSLSADAVAEHAFALLLAVQRKVAWLHRRLQEGHWEKQAGVGRQLAEAHARPVRLRAGRTAASRNWGGRST